ACGALAYLLGCECERDVSRKSVRLAAARFEFGGDNRAYRRNLARKRHVERASGLHVVLPAQVTPRGSRQRAHDRDAVHHLFEPRKHVHREVDSGGDLAHLEILGRGRVVFEIEGVEMADGARDLEEDHVAGVAARPRLAALRCPNLERPDAAERSADQAETAELQQIAAGWDQITDSIGAAHGALLVRSYRGNRPGSRDPT